jgi:hypothetical protein
VEFKIDAPIADVAVGGGGRYLILHLPKLKKLAVFDVNVAKITKFIAAPGANVKFTAGLDKLVLALPETRRLERWNLKTLELEHSAGIPDKFEFVAMSMGSATSGPITVLAKEGRFPSDKYFSLDLKTLKPSEILWPRGQPQSFSGNQTHLRTSFDGTALGAWHTNGYPNGAQWIKWTGAIPTILYEHATRGHVVPGPRGKTLFTGLGLFSGYKVPFPHGYIPYPGTKPNGRFVPALHGDYYLYLGDAPTMEVRDPPAAFSIHRFGLDKPILSPKGISVPTTNESTIKTDFTLDKRFHLIPEAKLLIVIPDTNDNLILHRVDLTAKGKK